MIYSDQYYTVPLREDGFGAQYQYYIWSILYTELNGGKFIMPKIKNMEHNYYNNPDFINKVRKYMNLENSFSRSETILKSISIHYLNTQEMYKYVEENIEKCINSQTLKKIKTLFWLNKKRHNIYNNDEDSSNYYNIAVHIRRPNVHDNRDGECVGISFEYYKKCIYEACEKYLFSFGLSKKKPIRIYIYSQGKEEDFEELKQIEYGEVCLKINEDMFESFTGMVGADTLILSASSFSYIAGFLSDGQIYYYPFWHSPSEKWNIQSKMKNIDLPSYTNWISN
jgi:hypothetical protein